MRKQSLSRPPLLTASLLEKTPDMRPAKVVDRKGAVQGDERRGKKDGWAAPEQDLHS